MYLLGLGTLINPTVPHPHSFSSDLDELENWSRREMGGQVPPSPPRGAATGLSDGGLNILSFLVEIKNSCRINYCIAVTRDFET